MPNWTSIYTQSIEIPKGRNPFSHTYHFVVQPGTRRLRISCQQIPSILSSHQDLVDAVFREYVNHPLLKEKQKALIHDNFCNVYQQIENQVPAVLLFDPHDIFRGRWDPSFSGRKEIGEWDSSDGFENGEIPSGEWLLWLYTVNPVSRSYRFQIAIDHSTDVKEEEAKSEAIPIGTFLLNEVNLAWFVGEIHEHSTRSAGLYSPEETIARYAALGYHFISLTDHDFPPLRTLVKPPPISLIRGEEIQWPFGHALLLGIHDWFSPNPDEKPDHLGDIIHDIHARGGLFCVLHPFAIKTNDETHSWSIPTQQWNLIDLLEVWSGSWHKRFPEILKAFDLWENLLNEGHRIFGMCGKGSTEPIDNELLEKSPKTVVLSEGLSETQILSALKQGHFYCTSEPAVSIHLESEFGSIFMGDELRIPIHASYILYVDISKTERTYLRIKTNKGVYCEMPASSARDTQLKFYERATMDVKWYRVEVYRFGRPLDELLAFSNPVFVRCMVSA